MNPDAFDLPPKFTEFRPGQLQLSAKIANSAKYAYLLDAPTGVGKSLIAATVQRIMDKKIVYLCTTKQLQDQILNDFPYAKTLKGRANYPCAKAPNAFPNINAEMCTDSKDFPCLVKDSCPYVVAKAQALGADLAVLNMAYFMSEANYVGGFSGRHFVVIDEADCTEDQLMSFVELAVTKRQLDRYGLPTPRLKTKHEAWIEWAKKSLDILGPIHGHLVDESERDDWGGVDYKVLRERNYIERLMAKLRYFVKEVDKTWVWYPSEERWSFKPTWVSKYSENVLWKHMDRVLMMSATILDPRQVSVNTGILRKPGRMYEYSRIDSPFPVEHRPVYYEPCANVVNKEMDRALPLLARSVADIINKYPDDKVLVHTISYKIRDYLVRNIQSDRFITHSSADRADVLERFKRGDRPMVMLSPSMDRGVDLPGEECRAIVIAKMPYPDLGDPQISTRVYGSPDGNGWYAHKTVSSIIQMAGRGVRSVDDYCDTYILDKQFERIYRDNRRLFPLWFQKAVLM